MGQTLILEQRQDLENYNKIGVWAFIVVTLVSWSFAKNHKQGLLWQNNQLHLHLENRNLVHPSSIEDRDSLIALSQVYALHHDSLIDLKDAIDTLTFEKVNRNGDYYQDIDDVFVYPFQARSVLFFKVSRSKCKWIGESRNYLIFENRVLYRGKYLDVDFKGSVDLLEINNTQSEHNYEFLLIEGLLFYEESQMNTEKMQFLSISKRDKNKLKRLLLIR